MNCRELGEKKKRTLRDRFVKGREKLDESDLDRALGFEDKVNNRSKKVPSQFGKLVNQIKLLFELLKDYKAGRYTEIPWSSIAGIVFSIIYFVSLIDLIPDLIPGFGYIDDAFVVKLAIDFVLEDLKKYCDWKGYQESDYF